MAPGGNYHPTKDLLTSPRVHVHRFKEMLCIAELLLVGDIPKPSDKLALQWYYMFFHKNDHNKFVLSGKTFDDKTIQFVTNFFQALFEQKKLDGLLKHQEVERIRRHLIREASEKLRGSICEASDGRCSQRARREIALCDD
jgi:hypothetical protein